MKKYNLFILGYGSSVTLEKWLHETHFPNTEIRILDNGGQTYTRLNSNLYHQTSQNLGCAGGWNLICNIAFNILKLDKVIISNEDNFYSEEYIEALYEQCTPTNISGTYDRAFEFSLFCIHKDTYNKIGMFDENIIHAAYEDNDYKYRCKLHGVSISCLGVSADYNLSETGGDSIPHTRDKNRDYFIKKWENETLTLAFNTYPNDSPELIISDRIIEFYNTQTFPSIDEYNNFLKQKPQQIKHENNL